MSFLEYKSQVIKSYQEKSNKGLLPKNLIHPTPGNLKKECIKLFSECYKVTDERTWTDFFGTIKTPDDYLRAMKKEELGKFKPLLNHLKGKTEDTDPKNIELLALLIDFNPRPYILDFEVPDKEDLFTEETSPEKDTYKPEPSEDIKDTEDHPEEKEIKIISPEILSGRYVKKLSIPVIIIITILLISFGIADIFKEKNCMYWTGDRFERIYFDQKIPNVQIVALDTFRLNYFRKILRTDTIKENSIGKIWYSKIDNKIEFFTAGGMHPEYVHKPLKPVSEYIFWKYIMKNEQVSGIK